jgi:hypothetical protein
MKLLEFDLEKALSGKYELYQRNGIKILEWKYFKNAEQISKCICAIPENEREIITFYNDGWLDDEDSSDYDLMLAVKPKKYYVNIYKQTRTMSFGGVYETLEELEKNKLDFCVKTVEFTLDDE